MFASTGACRAVVETPPIKHPLLACATRCASSPCREGYHQFTIVGWGQGERNKERATAPQALQKKGKNHSRTFYMTAEEYARRSSTPGLFILPDRCTRIVYPHGFEPGHSHTLKPNTCVFHACSLGHGLGELAAETRFALFWR